MYVVGGAYSEESQQVWVPLHISYASETLRPCPSTDNYMYAGKTRDVPYSIALPLTGAT